MEAMLSSFPEPLFADPALTAARRMSFEAFQREAVKCQTEVGKAADEVPSDGILLHDASSPRFRPYARE
eukprot:3510754-Lingulodinium_polyedra.AAC.1